MSDDYQPTKAEVLAGLITGSAKVQMVACTKQVSYRAPLHILARVDALAAHSGKSRAAMLTLLIDAGLEAVTKELPRKVIKELNQREWEALNELGTGDGSGEVV